MESDYKSMGHGMGDSIAKEIIEDAKNKRITKVVKKPTFEMKKLFQVRPTDEEGTEFMITIGKHLATEETFISREAAEERINQTDWNLVSAMVYAIKEAEQMTNKSEGENNG